MIDIHVLYDEKIIRHLQMVTVGNLSFATK